MPRGMTTVSKVVHSIINQDRSRVMINGLHTPSLMLDSNTNLGTTKDRDDLLRCQRDGGGTPVKDSSSILPLPPQHVQCARTAQAAAASGGDAIHAKTHSTSNILRPHSRAKHEEEEEVGVLVVFRDCPRTMGLQS